ncbi:hypothetical protein C8Q79DRAFT_978510 [Trametes meyenii]|nr:hypothetical protein C8Q79DRAFT_978510 [Trametes meyenii]
MSDTLITVPGVSAHHILGESNITLGVGDLNIVPVDGGTTLTLTVGSAAFALKKGVEFGTLTGDPRAYVFSPEIEGVNGGYVKLSLPEGVAEDGSRLSELQTRFEEVLVERGFLQPAEEDRSAQQRIKDAISSQSLEALVTIPGVIAAQVLGEETSVLSEGPLSLVMLSKQEDEDENPLLTLTVGKAAFPLYKTTTFGTLADDSRTYLFVPQVEGADKGFIGIVLPTAAGQPHSDLAELQNQFELILIEYGLLKDGFEAAADEVSQSVREDSVRAAERIREA